METAFRKCERKDISTRAVGGVPRGFDVFRGEEVRGYWRNN